MSWWSSAQSMPQNTSMIFVPPFLSVVLALSRAGHARSLMEGLKGTAIRLAVRDPSCPQGPGPGWSSRAPVKVRGPSCGWLRPRPPIPARGPGFPYPAGVSRMTTVVAAGGTGPRSRRKDRVPRSTVRITRHQPPPPRQAQPLSHKASRARRTQGLGSAAGTGLRDPPIFIERSLALERGRREPGTRPLLRLTRPLGAGPPLPADAGVINRSVSTSKGGPNGDSV